MIQPSSTELEIERIRELVKLQRFAEVLEATEALLLAVPENRDVLYQRALAQLLSGQVLAALDTLVRLERTHPRFSRLYQERGQCHVTLRRAPEAIAALLQAVHINPALPVSWSLLEGLYRMAGRNQEAKEAAAHVAKLKQLPPDVVRATTRFADGDLAGAEQLIRAYLLEHGHHIEAMRLLARIGVEQEVYDDAQLLL